MIMGLSRVVKYLFCRLKIIGETPNDDINPTPQSKPTMLHETSTLSWAEGSRRSLINVDLGSVKPNVVVAQDGSGNFKTITEAVNTAPKGQPTHLSYSLRQMQSHDTYFVFATINGNGFIAKDIGVQNSAGPNKHQAVALRVSADMTIFHNCVMEGHQEAPKKTTKRELFAQRQE
ncbi:pectinesterase-like protein [Tanacetum coccineum]